MLVSLMRYMQGYLKIHVTGYSPERFLNLCKNKKIEIWELESTTNSYQMFIKISDFRKLKSIVKKTKTKVTIEERIGLPFFFYTYRKRKGFWCGLFISILLIFSFTFFVWEIDCTGNQHITTEVILEFLEAENISPGILKTKVSCEHIAREIRKHFDDIIWVSCSLKGTKLMIHVKENSDTFSKITVSTQPCDLVATKNGIITDIITRNGVPKVSVGSEVKKGDVLVSGVVEIYNDAKEVVATHLVTADADVSMHCVEEYEEKITKKYKQKTYTHKNKSSCYVRIGKRVITLGFARKAYENHDDFTQELQIKIGKAFKLPISLGKSIQSEYHWETKEYSEAEMEMLLNKNFQRFCKKLEEQSKEIVEKDFVITQTSKEGIASSNLLVIEENPFERKSIDF